MALDGSVVKLSLNVEDAATFAWVHAEWWPAGDADLDEVDIDVRGTPIPTQVVDFRGTR